MNNRIDGLVRSLRRDWVIALRPDHPNLFDGPDILAGRTGRLLALFIPHQREISNPARLQARLVLTRLALGDHAWCVLVLGSDGRRSREPAGTVHYDFHAVVDLGQNSDGKAFEPNEIEIEKRKIPATIRSFVQSRTDYLFGLSPPTEDRLVRVAESRAGDHYGDALALSVHEQPELVARARKNLRQFKSFQERVSFRDRLIIARQKSGRPASVRQLLDPLLPDCIQLAFAVDNGVPYPLMAAMAGLLLADSLKSPQKDPLKPFRAAAFAGWAVVVGPKLSEWESLAEQMNDWLRHHQYRS